MCVCALLYVCLHLCLCVFVQENKSIERFAMTALINRHKLIPNMIVEHASLMEFVTKTRGQRWKLRRSMRIAFVFYQHSKHISIFPAFTKRRRYENAFRIPCCLSNQINRHTDERRCINTALDLMLRFMYFCEWAIKNSPFIQLECCCVYQASVIHPFSRQ